MRDDVELLLHSLLDLLSSKLLLLKKFEVNLQTIQVNLINENEEAIVTLVSLNNLIIEDISLHNYSISKCINDITTKIGIEYTQFEQFIKSLDNPLAQKIKEKYITIDSTFNQIYNLNQTLNILLTNHRESLVRNIEEINKIIELQTQLAY